MKILYISFALAISCLTGAATQAQTGNSQSAEQWVKNREWAPSGFALQLHPSTDKAEFARQYAKNKALWDKAFAFLKDHDLEKIEPGRYTIDSTDAYVTVTDAPSKEFDKTGWESHRKYIDLQYVARGKEKIGVAPVQGATVIKPYDDTKDLANYTTEGQYNIAEPGTFFLFFPQNAHRPSILVDGYNTVKKIVVKIKYAP